MAVYKCKMCGAQLQIQEGMSVCECEYCGTQQTLPKTDSEQILNMVNRANHFRQQCEFDKAADIYEKLIAQNSADAELYWSLVLCRYGIEYVDDPLTKQKIATCHRTQYRSILQDADYLAALEHADTLQRPVYEREAKYIDTVQKGILEISNKEEPFDVFICYKETDDSGARTPDSVLAQDLYYQLEREGFKVFFSRITLEHKLGEEYEPYIFAALNSAKVMVVVGTKPEYFNAVWVRNEWSRYLMLMREDRTRTLIPAYKDMDPYDLPDALSMFQAQDMSKLGFMQDLIHGISKIVRDESPQPKVVEKTVVQNYGTPEVKPLLKRASLFLEDKDWDSAKEYCNKVLDIDPECAQAYFYLLMADLNIPTERQFEEACFLEGIDQEDNYKKAWRFGDEEMRQKLDSLHRQTIYNKALKGIESWKTSDHYEYARELLLQLNDFRDAAEKAREFEQKALQMRYKALQMRYDDAINFLSTAESLVQFRQAQEMFLELKDFQDAAEKARECGERAAEMVRAIQPRLARARKAILPYQNKIAAGYAHTVGVQSNGKVIACGMNRFMECSGTQDRKWKHIVAVAAGPNFTSHITFGLKANGKVVATGDNDDGQCDVSNWTDIVAVAAGSYHTIGLKSDGTVVATGNNDKGQCDVSEWTDIVAVAAGSCYTIGLKSDGTVVWAEDNRRRRAYQCDVSDWTDIVAIAAGSYHTIGLKSDGTVVAIGANLDGECGVSDWTDIVAVAAAEDHTVGLKSNGTVVAVGKNDDGRCNVSDWTDIVAVAAAEHHTVGLKSNGTVVAVGENDDGQCNVSGWTGIGPAKG